MLTFGMNFQISFLRLLPELGKTLTLGMELHVIETFRFPYQQQNTPEIKSFEFPNCVYHFKNVLSGFSQKK